MHVSFRGRLLVSTPPMTDPNFDRTVVLMLEHSAEGALGIVLNRPTPTQLSDALPDWKPLASAPPVVFSGGPVAEDSVIALARGIGNGDEGWVQVLDDVGTVDIGRDPAAVSAELHELRIFVGYAGWGPGQLEGEIDAGGWFVVNARPNDAFDANPDALWREVLRRQRGHVALFANCPTDPATN
jgi:putative transcriptional regulator